MNVYEKIEKIIEAVARIFPAAGTFKERIMNAVRKQSEAALNSLLAEIKEIVETNNV
jgi:predicted house-cleaning noncanonical NTP pyrophosphatase (MazG superfamily)